MTRAQTHRYFFSTAISVALAIALTLPTSAISQHSQNLVPKFAYLADQESDPFMFLGKVMNPSHPQWKRYRRPLKKYASVEDCLEGADGNADALSFSWDTLKDEKARNICTFRAFRSLGSIENISAWLSANHFYVGELRRRMKAGSRRTNTDKPVKVLTAHWTVEQYRMHWPSLLSSWLGLEQILSFEIQVYFSEDDRVVGSITRANTK